jgi:hypothetical protein
MGQTGAGKSTVRWLPSDDCRLPNSIDSQFINAAAGKVLAGVGHSLLSTTATVEPITIPYPREPSRQIIFVDTPGFDNTYLDDSHILKRIADWLAKLWAEIAHLQSSCS